MVVKVVGTKKLLIIIILPLVTLLALAFIALLAYWLMFRGTNIGFLSLHPKYVYEIDWGNAKKFEEIVSVNKDSSSKSLIFLSPKVREVGLSSGIFNLPPADPKAVTIPLYYGEWSRLGPIDVLSIYVMTDNLEKAKKDKPDSVKFLLSNFLSLQFGKKFNLTSKQSTDTRLLMAPAGEFTNIILNLKSRLGK